MRPWCCLAEKVINGNILFILADWVKKSLASACKLTDREQMEAEIKEIINVCKLMENCHLEKFEALLETQKSDNGHTKRP